MSYYDPQRVFFGRPVTQAVKILIIINVIVFLPTMFGTTAKGLLFGYFGLVPGHITQDFMIWQFFTYMFLHDGFFHIFFNMLILFMFGCDLERHWGSQRFIRYYFITGVGAGVFSWLAALNSGAATIGASGAIYGLLLAYGILWPNVTVTLLLFFVLPFPIKVKYMVMFLGGMAFLSTIGSGPPGVAHIAHLGGMMVGLVYLKSEDWMKQYQFYRAQRKHEGLRRQFQVYYGDVRRKIENDKKKGPTIH